jgi:hypothetical protein
MPSQVNQLQPQYTGFQWGSYSSLRAKGPAYLSQSAVIAPRAHEIVDFGRRAWRSEQIDFSETGKDGWVYFAHRVQAPDMSCGRCHGSRKVWEDNRQVEIKGPVQQPGDPVGLFVVALRKS